VVILAGKQQELRALGVSMSGWGTRSSTTRAWNCGLATGFGPQNVDKIAPTGPKR
jgi:hypothetical protein